MSLWSTIVNHELRVVSQSWLCPFGSKAIKVTSLIFTINFLKYSQILDSRFIQYLGVVNAFAVQ